MGVHKMQQTLYAVRGLYFLGICYTLRGVEILGEKASSFGSSIVDKFEPKGYGPDEFELMDREIEESRNYPSEH